jgi:WD40 repeat protein
VFLSHFDPNCQPALIDGHVLIWNRDSGKLLHDLHKPGHNVLSIDWNHASESPMLATGGVHGLVRIWALPQQQHTSDVASIVSAPSVEWEQREAERTELG